MHIAPLVFLSSTKKDLDEYRAAILENLPKLDILYRGMELFGARAHRAKDVMLEEVRDSSLFVGLLGHCYGTEEPETGQSFTELEYREAVSSGIPVLMYLIDPSVLHRDDITESAEKREKLRRLKADIERNETCAYFTNPFQLATLVGRGIQRWLEETASIRQEQYLASRDFVFEQTRLLRDLYVSDIDTVVAACDKLARSGAVRALEHFYALIRLRSSDEAVVRAAFKAMTIVPGYRRVSEILLEFVKDPNPTLRWIAMGAVTECGRSVTGWISPELAATVLELAGNNDTDWRVREEVAHALPKVASKYSKLEPRCGSELIRMYRDDTVEAVKAQAEESLRDMGSSWSRSKGNTL
ncbi:MAG TPA: DUF4062 domain-containing protein [Polyangiaceae bacterium]